MATISIFKRKLNTKPLKDKEIEAGDSKANIVLKYGVPNNTLSTWIRNKEKIIDGAKKETVLNVSVREKDRLQT